MKKEEIEIIENNEDVEDLLSNKSALSEIIVKGAELLESAEDDSTIESSSEETSSDNEDKDDNTINVYSNNPDMKWYIVYVRTGQEQRAKEQLEQKIKQSHRHNEFGHVLVPSESVVELNKGKKRTTKRKFFPGYMLVQMVMTEDTWHFVKSASKIVGFVGGNTNPPSVPVSEVLRITSQEKEGSVKPTPKVIFEEGETVRVVEGPFTNFTGIVEEVRPEKAKLRVLVSIFGRSTPVELEFMQVEKM